MAEVTVGELAKSIGAPVERLLKQMHEAGLEHKSAEAKVSDDEKQRLLSFLKNRHDEAALEPKKNHFAAQNHYDHQNRYG